MPAATPTLKESDGSAIGRQTDRTPVSDVALDHDVLLRSEFRVDVDRRGVRQSNAGSRQDGNRTPIIGPNLVSVPLLTGVPQP